ncbi:MAG: hypothetical protein KAR35_06125 [Candidatus Heimdallarchaeota archaeon]|nr:hypothetical protein [Candidatus Heimdallarchaeota archaeon]MCK5048936.1 hypothetical protein [Candidatus Heimdallarchaeota archaeon]
MDWIKNRIQAEFRKHKRLGTEMCARLASAKIYAEIKEILYEEIRMERFAYGQGRKEACDKMELDILCRIYSDDEEKGDSEVIKNIKHPIKFYELNLILNKYCSAIQKEDDKSMTINFIKGDTWDNDVSVVSGEGDEK